jgi:hypothetical protein
MKNGKSSGIWRVDLPSDVEAPLPRKITVFVALKAARESASYRL